jgi:chloramphenicol 3-O phosphotransferase
VERIATPREPGRIIFLNGASSSGKSTLSKKLQAELDDPFLHVSSDQFVAAGMLPSRRDDGGPFDWRHQVRPRFFAGFHRCLPALALAGNNLIVEHIMELPSWRTDLTVLLGGLDVFLVGVRCKLDELDRRERLRGDRRPGEGRTLVELDGIHTFGPYDFDVDPTAGIDAELVRSVLAAWRRHVPYNGVLAHSPTNR